MTKAPLGTPKTFQTNGICTDGKPVQILIDRALCLHVLVGDGAHDVPFVTGLCEQAFPKRLDCRFGDSSSCSVALLRMTLIRLLSYHDSRFARVILRSSTKKTEGSPKPQEAVSAVCSHRLFRKKSELTANPQLNKKAPSSNELGAFLWIRRTRP